MIEPVPQDVRDLRRLKFSSILQLVAAVFFFGAGIIGGMSIGWGFVPFLLFALGIANIGLFTLTRKAITSRTKS
jgi:hypothetical protein